MRKSFNNHRTEPNKVSLQGMHFENNLVTIFKKKISQSKIGHCNSQVENQNLHGWITYGYGCDLLPSNLI